MKRITVACALVCLASGSAWAGVKETQHQQMINLAEQMGQLKATGQGGSSNYASLRAQYDQISAAMGGDDPGRAIPGGQPAVDGRSGEAPQGNIGVIPIAPVGCVVSTNSSTNNTPVPIPTTGPPNVVTSTINVAGAGPFLWDLNLRTFIAHSFSSDLDVTIESPAGTVVTLTTDNGGVNDNVYSGTVWDDDANPGGQVPYTTNNGLVTDHVYANLTLASPLVPEEAMGAFFGENPNGTWTLTISDDANLDGGSLDSWTLEFSTLPAPPMVLNTAVSNNTPVPIPTTGPPNVVTSTILVAGAGTSIVDVDLTTFIVHSFSSDLDITIESPAGTVVTLTTDNGGVNNDVYNGTVWNDDANPAGQVPYTTNNGLATDHAYVNVTLASPLVPEEALAAFIGEDPNGTWTLTISDDANLDGGSLNSWSMDIDTGVCALPCSLTCPTDISTSTDPGVCSAVVNYPAPIATGTCGTVTCAAPSGSSFPEGVNTVTCQEQGGPASCSFDITVNDTEPPVITCPADVEIDLPPGSNGQNVDYDPPATGDNCQVDFGDCQPPSGDFFPEGATPVNCVVYDEAGNSATCAFSVILNAVSVLEVPTISRLGLAALALLLAGAAFLVFRRQG